jgi:hypothetical protein
MFLHASRIAFEHPTAGGTLRFESPAPADFDRLERELAAASADAVLR